MIINLKDQGKIICNPMGIWSITKGLLNAEDDIDRQKEHVWVFLLDTRNKIKLIELVTLGILNSSIIHPREIFRRAVHEGCAHIIVAHNHPSDCTDPSEEDLGVTKRLKDAGKILGIELIDHVIVTLTGYSSLKERVLI